MSREKLIKEIIKMCQYFKILEYELEPMMLDKKVIDGLEDITFVENLLNLFYQKRNQKNYKTKLNQTELKKLLIELEKIRLDLEFREEG